MLAAVPCAAQTSRDPAVEEALAAISAWSTQARGGDPESWARASPRFQARIAAWRWQEWADKHVSQWDGVGAARVLSLQVVRTEVPDPPGEWVGVILVHDRARGGKLFERVWAVREEGRSWSVVDYALWPDGEAIVTNAYFRPIPWIPESQGERMIDGFYFLRRSP
jgi:hypothetical protein